MWVRAAGLFRGLREGCLIMVLMVTVKYSAGAKQPGQLQRSAEFYRWLKGRPTEDS